MRKVIAVAAASAIERGGRRVSAVGLQILTVLAVFGNQKLIQTFPKAFFARKLKAQNRISEETFLYKARRLKFIPFFFPSRVSLFQLSFT